MNKKGWIIFGVIVVLLLAGLVLVSSKNKVSVSDIDVNAIQTASEKSGNIADHVFGKADSKVVLIEYGDFQCPTCGAVHPIVQPLTEKYKDQIAFVFRNFPLTTIHPNARAAAAAAEAAGLQGKYWEMHNVIYDNQDSWSSSTADERTNFFVSYAKEIGIDTDKFKTDLDNADVNKKISFDQAIGKRINIQGTPTVYLNGQQLELTTVNNTTNLENALKAEMKKQNIALPN